MTENAGFHGHQGGPSEPRWEPAGWVDGAPTSGRDQSCAFCESPVVRWVHPLAADLVTYRVYGKGHTLPTFWALCERCESLYVAGDDPSLLRLMVASDAWQWETAADIDETIVQALEVFRRADRGARRLAG